MKVKDFKGNEVKWPPSGHIINNNETRPRSELHLRVRRLLREMYPTQILLEEVPIPGARLTLDFYIPLLQTAIECQGEQHFKYTPHFHGSVRGFMESNRRDQSKLDWCLNNNIKVVALSYKDDEDKWREQING